MTLGFNEHGKILGHITLCKRDLLRAGLDTEKMNKKYLIEPEDMAKLDK